MMMPKTLFLIGPRAQLVVAILIIAGAPWGCSAGYGPTVIRDPPGTTGGTGEPWGCFGASLGALGAHPSRSEPHVERSNSPLGGTLS